MRQIFKAAADYCRF